MYDHKLLHLAWAPQRLPSLPWQSHLYLGDATSLDYIQLGLASGQQVWHSWPSSCFLEATARGRKGMRKGREEERKDQDPGQVANLNPAAPPGRRLQVASWARWLTFWLPDPVVGHDQGRGPRWMQLEWLQFTERLCWKEGPEAHVLPPVGCLLTVVLLTAQQPLAGRDPTQTLPSFQAESWDFYVMSLQQVPVSLSEHPAGLLVRHTPEQHLALCSKQRTLHPHLPHCPFPWRELRGSAVTPLPGKLGVGWGGAAVSLWLLKGL